MSYLIVLRKHLLSKFTDEYTQIIIEKALTRIWAELKLKELIKDLNENKKLSRIAYIMSINDWDFNDFWYKRRWKYSLAICKEEYHNEKKIQFTLKPIKVFWGDSMLDYIEIEDI